MPFHRLSFDDIKGTVSQSTASFEKIVNDSLDDFVIEKTFIKSGHSGSASVGKNGECVYIFLSDNGQIEVDGLLTSARSGSLFLVPKGSVHTVYNSTSKDVVFLALFKT